jgi:hypothetical protein
LELFTLELIGNGNALILIVGSKTLFAIFEFLVNEWHGELHDVILLVDPNTSSLPSLVDENDDTITLSDLNFAESFASLLLSIIFVRSTILGGIPALLSNELERKMADLFSIIFLLLSLT